MVQTFCSVNVPICCISSNKYRPALGTKIFAIPSFIFNFGIFMGHKLDVFRVIKKWGGHPGFWGRNLEVLHGNRYFLKELDLKYIYQITCMYHCLNTLAIFAFKALKNNGQESN